MLFPIKVRVESADMVLSADDQELFFLARYALAGTGEKPNYDIWMSRRAHGEWAEATLVGPPISTAANEYYPVLGADGSLYINSDRVGGLNRPLPGMSGADMYRSPRLPDGRFGPPVNLGPPINNPNGTGDMTLAPDESYLAISLGGRGGPRRGELHVSFRHPDGGWGEPVSLGDTINTKHHEWCPMVTPDGKYLFFSRFYGENWETATGGDVFWVDIRVLDRFRPTQAAVEKPRGKGD